MDRVDGHATAIHDVVRAAYLDCPPIGIDLDVQVGPRQQGLRDSLEPPVLPLVLRKLRDPFVGRGGFVHHVGVVEDEAARRENECHRACGPPGRPVREAPARDP